MTTTTLQVPVPGEQLLLDRLAAWIAENRLPEPRDTGYHRSDYEWLTVDLGSLADLEAYRVAMGRPTIHLIDYTHHSGERRWHAIARVEDLPTVGCVVRAVVEIAERRPW